MSLCPFIRIHEQKIISCGVIVTIVVVVIVIIIVIMLLVVELEKVQLYFELKLNLQSLPFLLLLNPEDFKRQITCSFDVTCSRDPVSLSEQAENAPL